MKVNDGFQEGGGQLLGPRVHLSQPFLLLWSSKGLEILKESFELDVISRAAGQLPKWGARKWGAGGRADPRLPLTNIGLGN